jgi:hypothetical protein
MATNAELQQQVEELRALVQQLQQVQGAPPPPIPPPIPVPAAKEPKISEPPEINGKASEYQAFIVHCELFLRTRRYSLLEPEDKVAFVISRLRGRPADWARSLIRINSPLLSSWEEFRAEMDSMYMNIYEREDLRNRLEDLKQTGSAINYSTEFKTIANTLGIDDESKYIFFKKGLKSTVKTGLAYASDVDDFDSLVRRAIIIDQTQYIAEKHEKAEKKPSRSNQPQSLPSRNNTPQQSNTAPRSSGPPRSSSSTPSTPRPPLTNEEKDRREKNGLCRVCGSPDHWKKNCPRHLAKVKSEHEKQSQPRYPTPTSTSSVPPAAISAHVIFPPALRRPGNPIPQDPSRQDA